MSLRHSLLFCLFSKKINIEILQLITCKDGLLLIQKKNTLKMSFIAVKKTVNVISKYFQLEKTFTFSFTP